MVFHVFMNNYTSNILTIKIMPRQNNNVILKVKLLFFLIQIKIIITLCIIGFKRKVVIKCYRYIHHEFEIVFSIEWLTTI